MTTRVDTTDDFARDLRRLARKYPSVVDSVDELTDQLAVDDRPGARLARVGSNVYKVRLPNRSARRGKSGGFRVIYQERSGELVLLLIIYSKTEQADIPDHVIRRLIIEADDL